MRWIRSLLALITILLVGVVLVDSADAFRSAHGRATEQPDAESLYVTWAPDDDLTRAARSWDIVQLGVRLNPRASNGAWPNSEGLQVEVQVVASGATQLIEVGNEPTLSRIPPAISIYLPDSVEELGVPTEEWTSEILDEGTRTDGVQADMFDLSLQDDSTSFVLDDGRLDLNAQAIRVIRLQKNRARLYGLYHVQFDLPEAYVANEGLAAARSALHWLPRGPSRLDLPVLDGAFQVVACDCGLTVHSPPADATLGGEPSWSPAYRREQYFEVSNDTWVASIVSQSKLYVVPAFIGWLVTMSFGRRREGGSQDADTEVEDGDANRNPARPQETVAPRVDIPVPGPVSPEQDGHRTTVPEPDTAQPVTASESTDTQGLRVQPGLLKPRSPASTIDVSRTGCATYVVDFREHTA